MSHFERVARWNGWSHKEKGIQLATNLCGAVQQVLGCLTDFEVDDYDVLCSVLKKRFSPKERVPMYRSEFRNRKKFNGESVSDFGFSLSRLVNRAYGDLPWDARETIVVEQFIHGLDTDLKRCVFFFFRHPSTLNQAISFAEEFVSFNVKCLDVSREETVDDVPVEREVGEFDDQQSDLAEAVESLIETERQVLALSERTGFVARSSAQCRGLNRTPREFPPFVRYPSSILSNCSSKRGKGKDTDVVPEKT